MNIICRITALLLFTVFLSCEKPYFPEGLDANEKIPVIQGAVHNGPGPYEVSVFWAAPFGSDQMDPIHDATVVIYDDEGNEEELSVSKPGYYLTGNGFSGTYGRTYTLRVTLPTGDVYESTPSRLANAPLTYSTYPKTGSKQDYETNSRGEITTFNRPGIYYYVNMTLNTTTQYYYLYESRAVSQFFEYSSEQIPEDTFYVWRTANLNTLPNLKSTVEVNDKEVIKEHELGFIRLGENPYPAGWVVTTNIYSVSKEVFDYYETIVKQVSGNNQIFDPIPSQIKGNMQCLTDTAKMAFGIFEVSEKYTKSEWIHWRAGFAGIRQVELPYYYRGPTLDGRTKDVQPDFWVKF